MDERPFYLPTILKSFGFLQRSKGENLFKIPGDAPVVDLTYCDRDGYGDSQGDAMAELDRRLRVREKGNKRKGGGGKGRGKSPRLVGGNEEAPVSLAETKSPAAGRKVSDHTPRISLADLARRSSGGESEEQPESKNKPFDPYAVSNAAFEKNSLVYFVKTFRGVQKGSVCSVDTVVPVDDRGKQAGITLDRCIPFPPVLKNNQPPFIPKAYLTSVVRLGAPEVNVQFKRRELTRSESETKPSDKAIEDGIKKALAMRACGGADAEFKFKQQAIATAADELDNTISLICGWE